MRRRAAFVVAVLLLVVAAAYLTAARRTVGPPLDPASTSPDGMRALVTLLDRYAASVEVIDGIPGPEVDTAVLVRFRGDRDAASDLRAWVRGGGTLFVLDPGAGLTPPLAGAVDGEVTGGCPGRLFEGVDALDLGEARRLVAPPRSTACFGGPDGAALVVQPDGEGSVVSVGGPQALTNAFLGEADNAVLAVRVLAPTPDTRTAFLRPAVAGSGDRGLLDLVDTPVWAAVAQLALAFGVLVAHRARRLGRPIEDRQLVEIDSSELTTALGRLLEQNRRPDRAAAHLRDAARRELSAPLGLDLDSSVQVVVDVLAQRTSLRPDEVRRAVAVPVTTDDDLVVVAALLTRIRQEVLHDRSVRT